MYLLNIKLILIISIIIILKSDHYRSESIENNTNNSMIDEISFNIDEESDSEDDSDTSTHQTPKSILSNSQSSSNDPQLNNSHAKMFKGWIESKSNELYDLSMNFSGFHLLNETYNVHLRKDAKFSWINFTEMIINISSTISQVLYNKTLVVKNLSDLVEKAFNDYSNDTDRVIDSTTHVYYDAKSPKTFCDVITPIASSTTLKNITSNSTNQTNIKQKLNHKSKRFDFDAYKDDLYFTPNSDDQTRLNRNTNPHRHHNQFSYLNQTTDIEIILRKSPVTKAPSNGRTKKVYTKKTTTTTTSAPTTTTPDYMSDDYNDEQQYEDDPDNDMGNYDLTGGYWDVPCINRTFDENFKSVQKINRNESTIQVPINVYKQDIIINMTAYWTEALDEQFTKNYDSDNELFWQYFCSSNGMFRRYPAAYWTVSQQDFFDCRLQTWYIMAAASPKDVLILLDTSGSMTGLRLEIGKKLIEFILDTFTDNDFFNILTFSSTVQYLFHNESEYMDTFVQAGNENKQKFKDRLEAYKNTSQQGKLTDPLTKVFELFKRHDLVRSGCNKMIMIITDGHADDVDHIFKKYNNDKKVRVFSFKIGRDMTDPSEIKKLACDNNGEYYHVVTLTDINEHVYEYIPVLSRPMALAGVRETTWSNVFIGYLDKELKIAVARPAFRDTSVNYTEFEIKKYKNLSIDFKTENFEQIVKKKKNQHEFYLTSEYERKLIENGEHEIKKQQVLLGVVGVDVPVLKLISKVSPKYQMGVGIYIIMLDNNGFIVFHPSIKKEISNSQFDFKGKSHSIDLDKFEIPIDNDEDFEYLEHEMIDQITNNKTLDNWKREGLRVIRRRTEYVYTPVSKTPFSVAIASPSSFGRYYIELPSEKESDYERTIKENIKMRFDSNIQMYNCSYSYNRLTERLINPKQNMDYCIRYLFTDNDQVLAIKSDLTLHNIYYNQFNFSIFTNYPNLVKSSFYGTYSGITFYLPVTFFRPKQTPDNSSSSSSSTQATTKLSTTTEPLSSTTNNFDLTTSFEIPLDYQLNMTTPYLTTTEPLNMTTTTPLTSTSNDTQTDALNPQTEDLEAFNMSLNLFSTESNKHTYSFEKQYYTRSIEFSDYLRTEFKRIDEPIVIYFLNESSKDSIGETLSAALPIWLDKVPTAVAGVVYDAKKLQDLLFNTPANCEGDACVNVCNKRPELNVTCYLVDEHGIVVLTNTEQYAVIGQPLYKINPWLMLQLELDGLYDLIVTGNKLQDCVRPPMTFNSASNLFNLAHLMAKTIGGLILQAVQILSGTFIYMVTSQFGFSKAQRNYQVNTKGEINQIEWRIRNSHCFYFGIYSFNITKWRTIDPSELKTWCNATVGHHKHYMAGYLKQSNLIMVVVEDESQVSKCGSVDALAKNRPPSWNANFKNAQDKNSAVALSMDGRNKTSVVGEKSSMSKKNYKINRYRKNPEYCHNYYPNESQIFFCNSFGYSSIRNGLLLQFSTKLKFIFGFILVKVYFY